MAESSTSSAVSVDSISRDNKFWKGAFAVAGIMLTLVTYGVLQEKIMRVPYGAEKEYFKHSLFLVFCNRITTSAVSACSLLASKKAMDPVAPIYKYCLISVSNILTTTCQYEALKYVSFPVQTLAKCAKTIPVMVWGALIMQKRYQGPDYLLAFLITLGCSVFILYPAGADMSPYSRGRENTVWGVLLMVGYLGFDGFTSTFQDKLFRGYDMEIHNQIFYTTLCSCILSLTGLILQGHLIPAVEFVYNHHDCFFDIALLSTVATVSQFFISYTIRTFGALTFATIMTTRQLVSIMLSCVWFAHPLSWEQWIGAQKRVKEAVELLHRSDHRPSSRVYSTLIAACVRQRALELGRRVHTHTKASSFVPRIFISNRLLDMYSKCGSLVDAQMLFDEMGHRDLCSWNTMIAGYAKLGRLEQARKLFDEMPQRDNFSWNAAISGYVSHNQPRGALELFRVMQRHERSNSNKFTLSSALAASAAIPCLRLGKEVHGYLIRTELNLEEVVWSALLDLYGKCGSLDEAGGVRPNEYTFSGVLNACADHAAEHLGKEVHRYMMRTGYGPFSFAISALVHMYSKCGNTRVARKVFNEMHQPDLVSWTSLIVGYAQNGQPEEALHFFKLLLQSAKVRKDMDNRGIVKKPGELSKKIKEEGYVPGTNFVLHDVEEEQKEQNLFYHGEKLAVAFGIISTPTGTPIKRQWGSWGVGEMKGGVGNLALRGIIPPSLRMISIHRRLRSSILPTLRRRFGSLKFPAKWNRIWKVHVLMYNGVVIFLHVSRVHTRSTVQEGDRAPFLWIWVYVFAWLAEQSGKLLQDS
ncbi:UDP-galactose/UDP-glucose transporter 5B [Glycine soja]